MPPKRMNRDEFCGKLAGLDEDGLRKVLWNLYWRGTAAVRERIEGELDPAETARVKRAEAVPADPLRGLREVTEFTELARCGAYMAGDRRVSPRERSRWRLTFRRLVTDAQQALRAEESGPAEAALEKLVDLACETRDYDYFHSEDPMEAAQFVVSDAVALLWEAMRERAGFAAFAERAAPQFVRWESRFGWTRSGWGPLSQKETSLTVVLARMLRAPDMWSTFADRYLDALDDIARREAASPNQSRIMVISGSGDGSDWGRTHARSRRAEALTDWHLLLLDRLGDEGGPDRLERLLAHPALASPALTLTRAGLAWRRGDTATARDLVREVLERLPGHEGALEFAAETGAELPAAARRRAERG